MREGRLVVMDGGATGDALLDEALTIAAQKKGKKPQSVVTPLGKQVRRRLYERLVESGVLQARADRIPGFFPTHRWPPANDAAHKSWVRAGLVSALREGATSEARTGALISLLLALRAVPKAVDPASVGLSTWELNAKARQITEGDWAATAVRQAIDSMNAAIIAATASVVVVGGGSGEASHHEPFPAPQHPGLRTQDPSFQHWPALPVALSDTIVPDFPLTSPA